MTKNDDKTNLQALPKSEVFKLPGFKIFQRNDLIIQLVFDKGFYGELEDAQLMVKYILKLSNNAKLPLLVIYAEDNLFSKETREYIANHQYTAADGLVINGLALKLVANAYTIINKPKRPTKFFNNADDAIKWLKNFL